ncbi:hypothetical protein D9V86_07065 [Bacteroidetes/Chlorobi group bacterium ChocPot_Mid]|jgi:uncharacterized membrane protein YraQ (UPF0718 family)|nr:MAG: hypothetical protein D9V86_07065 [Bacteroidetes/Chlorobi group bacterium ChocPot_Mid]
MKKMIDKYLFSIITIVLFLVFVCYSYLSDFKSGIYITKHNFVPLFLEMLAFLPLMFLLIGLFDVWVPKEKVMKYIGKDAGIKGLVLIFLLATLQAGPLYAAFPVAHLLWKKGAGIRNIFIYLGFFSSLKIPMLTFEIGFLGLKFSILRTLLSIPVFVLIAIIMEKFLITKGYEINEG